jgi:hypothetical protein
MPDSNIEVTAAHMSEELSVMSRRLDQLDLEAANPLKLIKAYEHLLKARFILEGTGDA